MAKLKVLRPDTVTACPRARVTFAPRRPLEEGAHLILIENGKPRARDLLLLIAAELQNRYPISSVEVFSKPSAARPIEADEARDMAARAHLVVTGLGD